MSLSPLSILRCIIPEPHNRIDYSLEALPHFLPKGCAFVSCFILLAYCAHRGTSYLFRLLLLPLVTTLCFHCAFTYRWPYPGYNVLNWGQGIAAFFVLGKSLEFVCASQSSLNGLQTPVASAVLDALKTIGTMRGIGFPWSRGVYIVPSTRSPLPNLFLRQTILNMIITFFIFDVVETALKFFPHVSEPTGGMFYSELSFPFKYVISTLIAIVTITCGLSIIELIYDAASIIGVGIFGQSPSLWPPLHGNPWKATSLQDFWAHRWHQMLRRTFVVLGGNVGYQVAGRAGFVLGTFVASGLIHELAIYAMGHGLELQPFIFFTLQGVLVISEKIFERKSGRKVGGWIGRVWVYITIIGLGQPMVDSWLRRSLGATEIHPPAYSPTRWVIAGLGFPTPES